MAFYIPASARRRRLYVAATAAAVIGLAAGLLLGRLMAPSVTDRIHSVQADARQTSAGLRVIALHDTSNAVGAQGDANGGTDIVLQRTRDELTAEFKKSPWLSDAVKQVLLKKLDQLDAISDRTSKAFGEAAESLADEIDKIFST